MPVVLTLAVIAILRAVYIRPFAKKCRLRVKRKIRKHENVLYFTVLEKITDTVIDGD